MNKTLESIFIKQYEDLQEQLTLANKRIEELTNKKEEDLQQNNEAPVVFKTFSKECCYLDVCRDYEISGSSIFKELVANDVKEIIDNEVALKNYANMICDYSSYDRHEFVKIHTKAFPYSSKIQDIIILLEIYYYYNEPSANCYIMGDKDNLTKSRYFDIKEKDRLYKYGLEKFKEELEKVYKKKLQQEQEERKTVEEQ